MPNVFFLVDREQLQQALEALQDILEHYGSYWLKPGGSGGRLPFACSRR